MDTRAELLGKMQDVTLKERNAGWHIEKMMKDAKMLVVYVFFWGVKHYPLVIAIIAILALLWESQFTNQYHGMGYVFFFVS